MRNRSYFIEKRSRNCSFFFDNEDGFILLEVLIAFGILSLVIMGAIGLYIVSLKEVREINLRTLAFNKLIASKELEGFDYDDLATDCTTVFPGGKCEVINGKFTVCWKEICTAL